MRLIPTTQLKPGMKVAKTVYNDKGDILIAAGIKLKTNYIKRLKELNIAGVYVLPPGMKEAEVEEAISETTKVEAVKTVKKALDRIKTDKKVNYPEITKTVEKIIDELLVEEKRIVQLTDIRNYGNALFLHSVSVTVLSILIAQEVGYSRAKIKDIAAGALLHDVGITLLDSKISWLKEELTTEEQEKFKQHTSYGFQILSHNNDLSRRIAYIALQHHEKLDGTGYPRQLKGENIHDFAKLVGVANVYDTLTGATELERRLSAYGALNLMERWREYKLDSAYLDALEKYVVRYPVGSLVVLNTGQLGLVVEINKNDLSAPVIKVIKDKSGARLAEEKKIDLSVEASIRIKTVKNLNQFNQEG